MDKEGGVAVKSSRKDVMRQTIQDAYGGGRRDIKATVEIDGLGISIRIKGYATASEYGDNGSIIYIENRHGEPCVVCWADKKQEDPTDAIYFGDAKVRKKVR